MHRLEGHGGGGREEREGGGLRVCTAGGQGLYILGGNIAHVFRQLGSIKQASESRVVFMWRQPMRGPCAGLAGCEVESRHSCSEQKVTGERRNPPPRIGSGW